MARGVRPATKTAAAYDGIVAAAQMRNLRLIKSAFVVEAEGVGTDQRAWKHGYGCNMARPHYDGERGLISGLIAAEAWSKLGRRKIVSLKCLYLVAYEVDGPVDEDAAEQFIERVGKFAVYPYFRAHFAEVTSQAGVRLPPLPVLKEGRRPIPRSAVASSTD